MSSQYENQYAEPSFGGSASGPAERSSGISRAFTPALILVTMFSMCVAAYFAGRSRAVGGTGVEELPLIHAYAALSSEKYSLATGQVSEDVDGLFVLDHNSGLLQCSVIYPRLGRFMAQFTINVADALGAGGGKGTSYMMITGRADFPRSSSQPAAAMVVYVMDTATGNYACYGIPFDRVAMNANRPQQAMLVLIATGSTNPIVDRDKLR